MHWKLFLGLGLYGIVGGPTALGQFAVDRVQPGATRVASPLPFGGAQPGQLGGGQQVGAPSIGAVPPASRTEATPGSGLQPVGGYVAPVGGFQPAVGSIAPGSPTGSGQTSISPVSLSPVEIPSALGPNHPLAVRPEHGAYFICVKSYSRPGRPAANDPGLTARELAEGLANDLMQTQRGNVYLYEYVSDEKKAEAASAAAARQRSQAFTASLGNYQQRSQLQGMEFLQPDNYIRYKTFNYRDQVAVLIGGFKNEDEAVKALARIKTWPAPRDTRLMDGGAIASTGADGKSTIEKTFMNPFPQAMVVQNPSIAKQASGPSLSVDPFLVKLNEGRPYNLLKATGAWTLGVKSFSAPVIIQSKDADTGLMRKLGFGKGGDALNAGAAQAEMLAKVLRTMKRPNGQPLEAFVFHSRSGSIVTVGQFDSPNDPSLIETRRELMGLKFSESKDEARSQMVGMSQQLLADNILPMAIPRP